MTRFAGLGLWALLLLVPGLRARTPMTGEAVAGFERVDQEIRSFMTLVDARGAAVAISRDGKLLYSRGYGWRDRDRKQPTRPDTLFRIGSISKAVTAALIKELVREGKLTLDTKVFGMLDLKPARGRPDERLARITVDHLLEHKGGWAREGTLDPMFRMPDARRELGLKRPLTPTDVVRWMMGKRLDFDPGTKSVYSNLGYCVLGRVVEKTTGQTFGKALDDLLRQPGKIEDLHVGRNSARLRPAREAWYPVREDTFDLDVMDAHGGMIASAGALCQFMHRHWLHGERRDRASRYQWVVFGSLPGTSAMAEQRLDGIDVAVLVNNRRDRSVEADQTGLRKKLSAAIDAASKKGS